ncbi:MAG: hypothetical protein ACP5HK_06095 [Acidilobus sp.]
MGAVIAIAMAASILAIAYFMVKPQRSLPQRQVVANGTISVGPLSSYIINFTVTPNESPGSLFVRLESSRALFVYVVNSSSLGTLMKTGGAPSLLYEPGVTNLSVTVILPAPGTYSIVIMNKGSLSTVNVYVYAYVKAGAS